MSVRLLIVDDHEPVRRSIRSLLASRADWSVCGEAADGLEAVEMARQLRPDVVLMDMSLPRMDGAEATRIIRQEVPESQVIIISQNDPSLVAVQAAQSRAHGYVAKINIARELRSTIDTLVSHHGKDWQPNSGNSPISGNELTFSDHGLAKPAHPSSSDANAVTPAWVTEGGEMAERMRSLDWSQTQLGPMHRWPQSLKTSVSICLASRFPIVMYWGPEYVVLYNDAYSTILGSKHPWALGQTCCDCWAEIWDTIGPMLDSVVKTGQATWSDDLVLLLHRHGYQEECYFSFSFSPIRIESGAVGGVFTAVMETTDKVIGERRLRTLRDLAARAVDAKSETDAWGIAAQTLAENLHDVPFSILCQVGGPDNKVEVRGTAGIDTAHPLCSSLSAPGSSLAEHLCRVARSREIFELKDLDTWRADLPQGPWQVPPESVLLLPIADLGQEGAAGVLLAAVSPRKALNDSYRTFFRLVSRQIATSVADARSHEEERRRAEALAEIDRAKTLFFSNVSHEFRTPLTLMLGPLEDTLAARDGLAAEHRQRLEVAHRNSLRLLKLVNTLLDFSRLEAGRIQASYEATDLAALTAELASVFRSAIERAGLRFVINCGPLEEPVYIDREMWEKIMFNLLSNAFKFTLAGEIEVSLRKVNRLVELRVRDTGSGIPPQSLPHLFERFYRVKGAESRTFEGTGIGLALVQELVKIHGGAVCVESQVGRGSTFIVTVPLGQDHLPADRIGASHALASTDLHAEAYVQEALHWLPGADDVSDDVHIASSFSPSPSLLRSERSSEPSPQILLADDNADMREYVARLLGAQYGVVAAADGEAALKIARAQPPDLILADVMMPRLDGFGLLQAIRNDPGLKSTPVILLSARAGEESRIEGLESEADDYLVKPFSARELLARVGSQLALTRMRRQVADLERKLRAEAEMERSRLRELFMQTPAAICLLSGPEHRYTFANREYLKVTGRVHAEDFLGRTVREALPELEGQGFFELLDGVYRTGIPHIGTETKTVLNRSGNAQSEDVYFNFIYQPMRDAAGQVEGILVHSVDVTEQVHARREIEGREQQFRAIVETTPECVKLVGPDGTLLHMNESGLAMVEANGAEMVVGKSVYDLIAPKDRERFRQFHGSICRGERGALEFDIVGLNGARRHMDAHAAPLPQPDGTFIHLAVARDITERKQAERATALLAAIVDSSDDAIVSKNLDGIITSWNKSAERVFGYTAEEAIGRHVTLIIPPDRQTEEAEIIARIRRGERVDHFETVRQRKDGTLLDVSLTISPVKDARGRVIGASKVARDISERKRAEEALRESEERFRALVSASSYVIYRMSPDWSEMRQLDGRGFIFDTETTRRDWLKEYIHPNDRPLVLQAVEKAVRTKRPFELEHRVQRPDGTLGWALSRAVPVLNSKGEITEWFGAATDVTRRKEAEENYRKLAETLDAEVQARTKELEERNAEVLTQSQQLRELTWQLWRTQDEERRHVARELHDSAGQILTVLGINLAGLVERAKQRAPEIVQAAEETQQLVQELTKEIRTTSYLLHPPLLDESGLPAALSWYIRGLQERSGLDITFKISEEFGRFPREMELVAFRLVQECLTNVHRHSGSKSAIVQVVRESSKLLIEVRDQGKGISPEKLAEIKSKGSGVGIRGMRERLRQFHGEMMIESTGAGTTFFISIPVAKEERGLAQSARQTLASTV